MRALRLAVLVALPLAPAACGAARPPAAHPVQPTRNLEAPASPLAAFDAEFESLMSEHSLAEWHEYTGEGAAPEGTLDRLRAAERALFQRALPIAEAVLARADAPALERRRAQLWRDGALGLSLEGDEETSRLAHAYESALNTYAFERAGQRMTRSDVRRLAGSRDAAERRAAHEMNSGMHRAVAGTARALIRRRAAVARARGLSYGDAMLRLRGVEPADWDALAAALEGGTRARYRAIIAEGARSLGAPGVAPWDAPLALGADTSWTNARLLAANAVPFARAALGAMGFDLERPPIRIVVREFAFGGQTLSIRVPNDVRTVVRPQDGHRFYRTMLHELGHALAATRNASTVAVFKGYEWVPGVSSPGYDEGVAEVFGTLMDDPDFLAAHTDLTPDERARLVREVRLNAVVRLREQLARVAFERAALADPEQDLDALERRLDREIRLLTVPDDAPPSWAATPFLATYPVYTQSYVVASVVAAQVHAALRARFGAARLGPEAGRHITEAMFARGESVPWGERVRAVSGRALSADDLIAALAAP